MNIAAAHRTCTQTDLDSLQDAINYNQSEVVRLTKLIANNRETANRLAQTRKNEILWMILFQSLKLFLLLYSILTFVRPLLISH